MDKINEILKQGPTLQNISDRIIEQDSIDDPIDENEELFVTKEGKDLVKKTEKAKNKDEKSTNR